MALTSSEITTIHLRKLATPNKKYYGDDEKVYIGNSNGSLRLLPKSELTTYNISNILPEDNVQDAIDELAKTISKEVEVDFGNDLYQTSQVFNITDLNVRPSSKIIASKVLKTPSDGRDTDEIFAESLDMSAKPNNGNFDLYIKSLNGSINGKFIINYKL